jgi:methylphosphotriester-DNA--protein-cysteine methyltransferase
MPGAADRATRAPSYRTSAIASPEDYEVSCELTDLDAVALSRARGVGTITTLELDGVRLDHEISPFDLMATSEVPTVVCIGNLVPPDGGHVNGAAFDTHSFQVLPAHQEVVGGVPAWTPLVGIAIDPGLLECARLALGGGDITPLSQQVRIDDSEGEIRRIVSELLEAAVDHRSDPRQPAAAKELVEAIARALNGDGPTAEPRGRVTSFALVCDALEFAAAHGYRKTTVGEICAGISTSESRLRQAFRSIFGIGPKGFMTAQALNDARRQLLDPTSNATVTHAAADLGFWHFGRFARGYRELFGELPSETLRQRGPAHSSDDGSDLADGKARAFG